MRILSKLWKDKSAVLGLLIVLFLLVVALFAPLLAPYPDAAFDLDLLNRLKPPSGTHWFGTDPLGRDVLSRVILGTPTALFVALTTVGFAILIGVPLGILAGYIGGWAGEFVMRVTDVFLAVPQLILALAIAQLLGPSTETAIMALSLTYWPHFCRTAYAETRRLEANIFVDALQSFGASKARVMFMHILPNSVSVVIIRATVGIGFIILTAAVLGFLGMGTTPPNPEWGEALALSREHLPVGWWLALFPGLAIFAAVLGFNLLGDGLRDIFDPRIRRSR